MELSGKRIIALGERDGIQGPAIAECAKSAGADIALIVTQCFVWTAAGSMDLDGQSQVLEAVKKYGKDNLVVLLGAPDPAGAEMFALTLTEGDPTFAGPLAGVSLGLPVYHVLESAVKEKVDPRVYDEQVGVMEMALDAEAIISVMEKIRADDGGN